MKYGPSSELELGPKQAGKFRFGVGSANFVSVSIPICLFQWNTPAFWSIPVFRSEKGPIEARMEWN